MSVFVIAVLTEKRSKFGRILLHGNRAGIQRRCRRRSRQRRGYNRSRLGGGERRDQGRIRRTVRIVVGVGVVAESQVGR